MTTSAVMSLSHSGTNVIKTSPNQKKKILKSQSHITKKVKNLEKSSDAISQLQDIFPDWSSEDLTSLFSESFDDIELTIQRITEGFASTWQKTSLSKKKLENNYTVPNEIDNGHNVFPSIKSIKETAKQFNKIDSRKNKSKSNLMYKLIKKNNKRSNESFISVSNLENTTSFESSKIKHDNFRKSKDRLLGCIKQSPEQKPLISNVIRHDVVKSNISNKLCENQKLNESKDKIIEGEFLFEANNLQFQDHVSSKPAKILSKNENAEDDLNGISMQKYSDFLKMPSKLSSRISQAAPAKIPAVLMPVKINSTGSTIPCSFITPSVKMFIHPMHNMSFAVCNNRKKLDENSIFFISNINIGSNVISDGDEKKKNLESKDSHNLSHKIMKININGKNSQINSRIQNNIQSIEETNNSLSPGLVNSLSAIRSQPQNKFSDQTCSKFDEHNSLSRKHYHGYYRKDDSFFTKNMNSKLKPRKCQISNNQIKFSPDSLSIYGNSSLKSGNDINVTGSKNDKFNCLSSSGKMSGRYTTSSAEQFEAHLTGLNSLNLSYQRNNHFEHEFYQNSAIIKKNSTDDRYNTSGHHYIGPDKYGLMYNYSSSFHNHYNQNNTRYN